MAADTLVSECSGSLPGSCPASRVEVPWDEWAVVHLAWPVAAQAVLVVLFWAVLGPGYRSAYRRGGSCLRWLVRKYIGTPDRQAKRPSIILAIFAADMAACALAGSIWLLHTYERKTSAASRAALLAAALVHVAASAVGHLRAECTVGSALTVRSWVDAFTTVPTLHLLWHQDASGSAWWPAGGGGVDWLSLHWLRAASVIDDFQQIQGLSRRAKYTGLVAQMVVLLVLRIICLIMTMAGVTFTSEVLGELPFFDYLLADRFFVSPAGDRISPTQMCYWIVVSITTVGYGDFAPRTVIGRALTSIFIVAGFLYLFLVQVEFTRAWAEIREGSGTYRAKTRKRGNPQRHVVVVLCTRRRAVHFSSMLAGFLREILHTERSHEWPDVVIFSRMPWDAAGDGEDQTRGATFDDFLRAEGLSASVRKRVFFIVGKLSSRADMDRAAIGQSLAFLLADVASEAPDRDDEENLFTAVLMRQFFPDAHIRVMLLRPQSKDLAVQAGIEISRCFSLQELKANILAQNVRCHGLVPMITGMLLSVDVKEESRGLVSVTRRKRHAGIVTDGADGATPHGLREPIGESNFPTPSYDSYDMKSSGYSSSSDGSNSHFDRQRSVSRVATETRSRASSEACSRGSSASNESITTRQKRLWRRSEWKDKVTPWILDYMEGLQRSVFGFELSENLAGLSFGEISTAVFTRTGAIVIATFLGGQLLVCPQDMTPAEAGQIFFAVAKDETTLAECRKSGRSACNWRRSLLIARHLERRKTRQGPHVSASKLLGRSLRRALVPKGRLLSTSEHAGLMSRTMTPSESLLPFASDALPVNDGSSPRRRASGLESVLSSVNRKGAPGQDEQRNWVRSVRAQLAHTQEELVVVIVCQGEVWQQVRTFVTSLCAPHLPDRRTIVVVAPTEVPRMFLDEDSDSGVVVVEGNCAKVESLIEAGILEASAVVVMSGQAGAAQGRDALHQDTRIVLCAQVVECWCGMSGREAFTTYELQHSGSLRKLPKLCYKHVVSMADLLSGQPADDRARQEQERAGEDGRRLSTTFSAGVRSLFSGSTDSIGAASADADPEGASDAISDVPVRQAGETISAMYHPRFAAGQIFTPELWGAMLGFMFHMPAIIELVEALVMPHQRDQRAYPWQMRVPAAYAGHRFSELFGDLALDHFRTKLGSAAVQASEQARPSPGLQEDDEACPLGPAVALALYRRREETLSLAPGTGWHNYTILAPPPSTRLRTDDWVVVLGSASFGSYMHRVRLLRGSTGAPS